MANLAHGVAPILEPYIVCRWELILAWVSSEVNEAQKRLLVSGVLSDRPEVLPIQPNISKVELYSLVAYLRGGTDIH